MSGSVKNHMDDTTSIDHMFVVRPSARQAIEASLKALLLIMFILFVFLAGGMWGAHVAANDPGFVEEYLTLTAPTEIVADEKRK